MNNSSRASHWSLLLTEAERLIAHINRDEKILSSWVIGGGTALMLHINHRTSYDIDIFFDDPQLFNYIRRAVYEAEFSLQPTGSSNDGTRFIKVSFGDYGEIDFICSANVCNVAPQKFEIDDKILLVDSPEEIIAKKIFYRGASIQPRDIFDIACVAQVLSLEKLVEYLRPIKQNVGIALRALGRIDEDYYRMAAQELAVRERFASLRYVGYQVTRTVLASV
jgi:predicted nucleotidyltransferase component of viral defense system